MFHFAKSEDFNPPCGGLNLSDYLTGEEDYEHQTLCQLTASEKTLDYLTFSIERGIFMAGRKLVQMNHLILSSPCLKCATWPT